MDQFDSWQVVLRPIPTYIFELPLLLSDALVVPGVAGVKQEGTEIRMKYSEAFINNLAAHLSE